MLGAPSLPLGVMLLGSTFGEDATVLVTIEVRADTGTIQIRQDVGTVEVRSDAWSIEI